MMHTPTSYSLHHAQHRQEVVRKSIQATPTMAEHNIINQSPSGRDNYDRL